MGTDGKWLNHTHRLSYPQSRDAIVFNKQDQTSKRCDNILLCLFDNSLTPPTPNL